MKISKRTLEKYYREALKILGDGSTPYKSVEEIKKERDTQAERNMRLTRWLIDIMILNEVKDA